MNQLEKEIEIRLLRILEQRPLFDCTGSLTLRIIIYYGGHGVVYFFATSQHSHCHETTQLSGAMGPVQPQNRT